MNKYAFLTLLALASFGLFACSQEEKQPALFLNVGTTADFAPFSYIEDGEFKGFDIDIAQAVANKLDLEIALHDLPFDALIPDLTLGNIHFVAAGMTATEERAQKVFCTPPYLDNDPFIAVSSLPLEPITSVEVLKNYHVGVAENYTADLLLSETFGDALTRLPTTFDGVIALKSQRLDIFVTASNTLAPFKKEGFYTQEIPETSENCSLFVSKKFPQLFEEITQALAELKEEGTLDKLKEKWGLQ